MSSKFDDTANFPDDKSVHMSYPQFKFEPSNKELLFLIHKAQSMKNTEDLNTKVKEEKRKPKLGVRNMMRIEQRSSSSMSHYSLSHPAPN
mmetsp:Transcript_13282/g.11757  ORF Transcript_13282/g.11757 Transcript_13282/m.11757 type:complete len:90 (+) Transcript_13282:438-707(+)